MEAAVNRTIYSRYKNGIQIRQADSDVSHASTLSELFNLPFNVCFLDRSSRIYKLNNYVVEDYGFISATDAVNKTVRDVVKMNFAQLMLKHNSTVIHEGKLYVFEEFGVTTSDVEFAYIVIKMPVYRDNLVIGLLDFAFNVKLAQYQLFAANLTRLMSTNIFGFNADVLFRLANYKNIHGINITPREEEIMRLIVRGKTAKEIAIVYQLSFRTVQHIIDRIKIKTKCQTKADLIEFALDYLL